MLHLIITTQFICYNCNRLIAQTRHPFKQDLLNFFNLNKYEINSYARSQLFYNAVHHLLAPHFWVSDRPSMTSPGLCESKKDENHKFGMARRSGPVDFFFTGKNLVEQKNFQKCCFCLDCCSIHQYRCTLHTCIKSKICEYFAFLSTALRVRWTETEGQVSVLWWETHSPDFRPLCENFSKQVQFCEVNPVWSLL